jgi:hypothetical protein
LSRDKDYLRLQQEKQPEFLGIFSEMQELEYTTPAL